jgi:hypothetical protein
MAYLEKLVFRECYLIKKKILFKNPCGTVNDSNSVQYLV